MPGLKSKIKTKMRRSPEKTETAPRFKLREPILPHNSVPSGVMQQFTSLVTPLIKQYNEAQTIAERLRLLGQIKAAVKQIDETYSSSHFANSPDYQKACADLYMDMQVQYKGIQKEGLKNRTKRKKLADLWSELFNVKEKIPTLPEIIDVLPPDKVNDLLIALINKDNNALSNLYAKGDDSDEAKKYHKFLKNNQIRTISTVNSIIFRVERRDGSGDYILQVENRLNTPKNVAADLRSQLSGTFTSIYAERQAYCKKGEENLHRSIVVTDYCNHGSLFEYRKNQGLSASQNEASLLMQMSSTLLDMQAKNFFFPDAKITNWLVHKDKSNHVKLKIADSKSFLYLNEKGEYKANIPGNHSYYLSSTHFDPPEAEEFNTKTLSADAIHAYILGKNIYCYLLGLRAVNDQNGANFDFSNSIFLSPDGTEYKALIVGLVNPDPDKRMSVGEANNRLFILSHPECKEVFTELKKLSYGTKDKVMENFIRKKQKEYEEAKPEQRQAILQDLRSTLNEFGAYRELKNKVNQYRENAGVFTIGMKRKAGRVEAEILELSVEERRKLGPNSFPPGLENALRDISKEKKIDPQKAAAGCKTYKDRLDKLHPADKEPEPAPKKTQWWPIR